MKKGYPRASAENSGHCNGQGSGPSTLPLMRRAERVLLALTVLMFSAAFYCDARMVYVFVYGDLTLLLAVISVALALLGACVTESRHCQERYLSRG